MTYVTVVKAPLTKKKKHEDYCTSLKKLCNFNGIFPFWMLQNWLKSKIERNGLFVCE